MFPPTLTIPSDNTELKLISINKEGDVGLYQYTRSITKKGKEVSLTEKQIKNLYKRDK